MMINNENFIEENLEKEIDLLQYWYIIRRRYRILLTFFLMVVISTLVFTAYQIPIYRATTTLIIEPDIPQAVNIGEAVPTTTISLFNFYQTQYDIIKSYTVSQKACEVLGISENTELPDSKTDDSFSFLQSVHHYIESYPMLKKIAETMGMTPDSESSETKATGDPVIRFQESITVSPVRDSRLVKVSIDATDPEAAANYANTLARVFIRHNLEDRKSASNDAFTWLSEQLAIFKAKVEKSETALLKFKEKEDIVSLDKRQILLEEKMSALHDNYTNVATRSMELKTISEEMNKLKRQPEMAESLPRILENPLIQKLKGEYSDLNAELASISKKFKSKHPKIITLKSQIENIRSEILKEVSKISKSIEIEYRINKTNENTIKKNLDDLKQQSMRLAQQAIEYNVLKRDSESNRQMYDVLLNRLKETDISGSITANNIRVVDEARVPFSPIKPKKKLNFLLSIVLGLLGGTGLCFFFEYIDDTLKDEEDVKIYLKTSCMGLVLKERSKISLEKELPKMLVRCYQDIKTTLSFYKQEHVLKTLLITSPSENEGKTTSAVMLGRSFANSGVKTLLIDADLFKARLGKLFQMEEKIGISDYFLDNKSSEELVKETQVPNLYLMQAGLIPRNPSEIIGSEKFKSLIESVKNDFEMIIIDSPPLNAALEVSVLGSYVDGIVLVIRGNKTPRSMVMKTTEKLKVSMQGNIIGAILTFAKPSHSANKYYYKYYYSEYRAKS